MLKIKMKPPGPYPIIKRLSWYNGPIRHFFGPEPGSLVPLNLLAALFQHSHTDISMRILHGYTSLGLLPGLIVSFFLFIFVNKNRTLLLVLAIFFLAINLITFPINTWISLNGMNLPYGRIFHVFVSVVIVINFVVVEWSLKQSLDKQ